MPCCLEADDGAMVGALWCVNEASKAGVNWSNWAGEGNPRIQRGRLQGDAGNRPISSTEPLNGSRPLRPTRFG